MNLINSGKRIMKILKTKLMNLMKNNSMEIVLIEIIHCLKH